MNRKTVYVIDGSNFSTLEEFYAEIGRILIPGAQWGQNLEAFNDILRGGFGTPPDGFIFLWKHSDISRERLGYPETVRQLEKRLSRCHSGNRESVAFDLEKAKNRVGATVFDWLVEIIKEHCQGGPEEKDGVELILE